MKKPRLKMSAKKAAPAAPKRITNDTVAEHREKVLAGGRKFKYPVQYSRHKILINTVIITAAALLIFLGWGWWMLYKQQTTNDFFYSATKVAPVPVASVDGVPVKYSDYLRRLRSSLTYLQRNNEMSTNPDEARQQVAFLQRQEMNEAQRVTWARSLAKANDVTVTDQEVEDFITKERESAKTSLSESAFEKAVLRDFYGWTIDDYRQIVRDRLILQRVSFAIDKPAKAKIEQIEKSLKVGADFAKTAAEHSDDMATKGNGGSAGPVSTSSLDNNGLIAAAKNLQPGQISGIIKGVDGYYIIKLNKKTDTTVDYSVIKVALTEFDRQFEQLRKDGKINEYIKIDDVQTEVQQR